MYEVDALDRVIELSLMPQSSVGAPLPLVVASEHSAAVTFYVQNTPEGWDGTSVELVTEDSHEPWATVLFRPCYAHTFGPPNDEAFAGHPLAGRCLAPYGAFVVQNSSWLRRLERMNAVHPRHNRDRFMTGRHHFILSFHDTTFECLAANYSVFTGTGPLSEAASQALALVREHSLVTKEFSYPSERPREPHLAPKPPKAWWHFWR